MVKSQKEKKRRKVPIGQHNCVPIVLLQEMNFEIVESTQCTTRHYTMLCHLVKCTLTLWIHLWIGQYLIQGSSPNTSPGSASTHYVTLPRDFVRNFLGGWRNAWRRIQTAWVFRLEPCMRYRSLFLCFSAVLCLFILNKCKYISGSWVGVACIYVCKHTRLLVTISSFLRAACIHSL